jgi:hypothetical protein
MSTGTQRGTTNGNARGGSQDRRRRREWLVITFRANEDLRVIQLYHGALNVGVNVGDGEPACRCGVLLTADTLTVDRVVPGCQGGTYRRDNIRPSCQPCASSTGARTRRKP